MLRFGAYHARSRLISTAGQLHAVVIHTPAIASEFLILALDGIKVAVLLASRYAYR